MNGERQPFTVRDIFSYKSLAGLQVSASRRLAVVAVTQTAEEGYQSQLWLLSMVGEARQLTAGEGQDASPQFSPDGMRVAFLSDRQSSRKQIFIIEVDGGEARQLSYFEDGVESITWTAEGNALLAVVRHAVDPESRGQRADTPPPERSADSPKLIWRLPYKLDGQGYVLAEETHLHLTDAVTGEATRLTNGSYQVRNAQMAPDGRKIAFVRTREGRLGHRTDLWLMQADGSSPVQVTHDIASCQTLSWAPDGSRIALIGSKDEGDARGYLFVIDTASLVVSPFGDGSPEVVAGTIAWSDDSTRVVCIIARRGRQQLASIGWPTGEVNILIAENAQTAGAAVSGYVVCFTRESADCPMEVYKTDWSGAPAARLSRFNEWWNTRTELEAVNRCFSVPTQEGAEEEVEGWLIHAREAPSGQPLLIDVHGGPASYAMLGFEWRSYWPVLCAQGWTVLALNPVGSSSYDPQFAERLRGRWGVADLPQHLAAANHLVEEGICDRRWVMTGKSYGGYLTAWALGQNAPLRAAIVSAPVANVVSHYGSSDSGYYADPYSLNSRAPEERDELSPIAHLANCTVPTLILQGEADERCPKGQSEELATRLFKETSAPVELVLYPNSGHHFFETGSPAHRLDALTRLVEWATRWISEA